MLARIRKAKEENEGGFTLIELLVVVVIIGILAAIAIPTFLSQREKAWQRALSADLHSNAIKMEEYLDDNGSYPTAAPASGLYKFKNSGSNAATSVVAAGQYGYCLKVDSVETFTGDTAYLDSRDGKAVVTETAPAGCTAAAYAAP